MPVDMRIRRAAGFILWRMARGATLEAATLEAGERERELSPEEMAVAQDYAEAALLFKERMAALSGHVELVTDPATGQKSYQQKPGTTPVTLGEVIDETGLRQYQHRRYNDRG